MESPASGPTELPLTGWRPPWWRRSWQMPKLASGRYTGAGLVVLVLFLAAWLRLSHLGEFENLYYTATVKSMLSSAHNFLFASFDPGGVVMVDKPPFGFWVDAIPASIFGVNSTSVSVLHGVAGVASVGLLYLLLRPVFGMTAALVAALTLAVVPASVFVDSRNELDSLVVFELLAATWCLVRAAQDRRRWWLLAWAALMGIAFNTKMLVAFVPLPAFILYYLLASDGRWRARLAWTGAALLLLGAVSLSWVTLVAVTPADQRPYVGSTQDNSIWTLAFKYNALNRFVGGIGPRPPPGGAPRAPLQTGRPGPGALPPAAGQPGQSVPPSSQPGQPQGPGLLPPPPGPPPGDNSIMNLFTERLAAQLGGLLFLAIIGFAVAAIRLVPSRVYRHPRSFLAVVSAPRNGQIVLWGSWLVTGILVFGLSAATVTHPYYLAELTPPVAAALGIGSASVWRAYRLRKGLGYILAAFLLAGAAYELYVFRATAGIWAQSLVIVAGVTATWLLAIAWLRSLTRSPLTGAAVIAGAIAVLWLPLVASWNRDVASSPMPPRPGPPPGLAAPAGAPPLGPPPGAPPPLQRDTRLVDAVERYIQAEEGTSAMSGIAAVRASEVAPFIVRGMPAVAIGGFSGSDPIFTLESFQEFVRSGKVGHFLLGAGPPGAPPTQVRQPVIQWVQRTWQDVSTQAGLPTGTLYRFPEPAQFSGGWQRVTPGSGAGQPPTGQGAADGPWRHRVVSASSADGLAWKADGVVLADQASVPDAVVDREGRIRVYYVDWRNQGITVAIARADGEYDYYQVALAGQPFKQMVDPDVVLLPDGRYRMFYVASTPGVPGSSNRIESSISDDGVVFTQEPGVRLEGLGLTDPDVILVGDVWYAYVSLGPRNLVYISRDGNTFTFLDYLPFLGSVSGTIPVEGGYRMYYHASAGGPGGSLSVHSAFLPAGGAAWQYEGLRLAPTAGSLDALGVADPAPVRLSDGTFKMFYKTFIP